MISKENLCYWLPFFNLLHISNFKLSNLQIVSYFLLFPGILFVFFALEDRTYDTWDIKQVLYHWTIAPALVLILRTFSLWCSDWPGACSIAQGALFTVLPIPPPSYWCRENNYSLRFWMCSVLNHQCTQTYLHANLFLVLPFTVLKKKFQG